MMRVINKRIWLTGAAIIAVVFLFFFIQKRFFLQDDGGVSAPDPAERTADTEAESAAAGAADEATADTENAAGSIQILPVEEAGTPGQAKTIRVETERYIATFSNRGGVLKSLILKDYRENNGRPVEMVLRKAAEEFPFSFRFASFSAELVTDLFASEKQRRGDITTVEFTKRYVAVFENDAGSAAGDSAARVPFTLLRRYSFTETDFLIKHETIIKPDGGGAGGKGVHDSFSYAIEIGPQIGPDYQELDNRTEYRYFVYLSENGRRTAYRTSSPGIKRIEDLSGWCGIEGKYFVFLAAPDAENFECVFDSETRPGIRRRSAFHLSRQPAAPGDIQDTVYFYAGPKRKELLLRYNSADTNGFEVSSLALDKVLPEPKLIGRIAGVLRQILRLFYRIVPNYGIAIILLAVIIRGALLPLALRQERQKDKIEKFNVLAEEIRKKYPDDQGRANAEIQELYKQKQIRPVGRAWPLLIQLPILVALYYLLNTHFDLRAAGFLNGWIEDLSIADKAIDFFPKRLPVVKWTSLNLLPLLLFVVLLVQARVVERPESGSRTQTIFSFLFPVVVLLIMYNLPAGVVLYFFIYSALGILQFYLIKRFRPRIIEQA